MELFERQMLVRRISSGKLYGTISYQNDLYDVVFSDPSLDLLARADWIYKNFKEKAKDRGALTIEETYQILIQDGKWNNSNEKELTTIKDDIDILRKKLMGAKYNKSLQAAIKKTIQDGEKRFRELYFIKNQLASSTVEHLSEVARQNFVISKISKLSDEAKDLIDNSRFRELLRVYYFEENSISESQIRELARTDPWRLYWTASKDTGTPLFPHSTVEFTDSQYHLVLWSKLYDHAYESSNRPTNSIIEDDVKFDAWYKDEMDRREKEIEKNSLDNDFNKNGAAEVFIPADEEGAKEVYELNNVVSRGKILQKQKFIQEKGEVKEADLPDVKEELMMQINRSGSNDILNRS